MRTDAEKREYTRGYNRGYQRQGWHEFRPPCPPDPIVGRMVKALQALNEGARGIVQVISDDDDFAVLLRPLIEEADESLIAMSKWLKEQP